MMRNWKKHVEVWAISLAACLIMTGAVLLIPGEAQIPATQVVIGPQQTINWAIPNGASTGQIGPVYIWDATKGSRSGTAIFSWAVNGTAPSVCTLQVEGSNDGVNWFSEDVDGVETCTSAFFDAWGDGAPFLYVRLNLVSFTPGDATTTLTVNWAAVTY